ncbi:transposase [Fredinandcohnia humi]
MARKHRIWFPGAKFHITSRGIRKTALFFDDNDHKTYLNLVKEAMTSTPFLLHAHCLMTTHIHLQIETIDTPPGPIMKKLHTAYARYFNQKYDYTGHVFEGRYGAQLIDTTEYELDVSKYIHLNPVKAKIVEHPEDYLWSSFRDYLSPCKSSFVHTSTILSYFPEPQLENYRNYINCPFVPLPNSTSLYTDIYQELLKSK